MKLAVISDIHSDLFSLEKALMEIRQSGYDQILCLGDIVGYSYHYADYLDGRDSDACIQLVKENCDKVICGNHDLHAVLKLPSNYREIEMPPDWYEMDLGERMENSKGRFWMYDDEMEDHLNEESREYLEKLPESLVIKADKFSILATHFISPDLTGSKTESPSELKDFRAHLKLVKKNKCLVGLAGHAHPEGYAQISKKAFGMNYFRETDLIRSTQTIIVPAITRSKARNGYLVIDTEKFKFKAIALD
ncbi:metallophosphoesterase family protein [Bacteroidota bacterium]